MPELPEVEIARRALHRWSTGRRVVRIHLPDPAVVRPRISTRPSEGMARARVVLEELLLHQTLGEPLRRAKRLGWPLEGGGGLLLHLGMTGRWVREQEEPPHARVGLQLDDGHTLWMRDPRRFGCVVPTQDLRALLAQGLGRDGLLDPPDGPWLRQRLGRSRRAVKVALLDQSALAGLGNIHAAEILWRARIAPARACADLDSQEWERVALIVPAYLQEVLDREPDEIIYLSEGGDGSSFDVYGKHGQACSRCAGTIERFAQSGRSTWWCPGCQG